MARIAGVDVPRDKRVEISLTYIHGVGSSLSRRILQQAQVGSDTKVRDLTDDEVSRIREIIDRSYMVEGDLRRDTQLNIKRLVEIGSYRGMRHRRGLPAHGQRTHTNARTKRGRPKTVAGRSRVRSKK